MHIHNTKHRKQLWWYNPLLVPQGFPHLQLHRHQSQHIIERGDSLWHSVKNQQRLFLGVNDTKCIVTMFGILFLLLQIWKDGWDYGEYTVNECIDQTCSSPLVKNLHIRTPLLLMRRTVKTDFSTKKLMFVSSRCSVTIRQLCTSQPEYITGIKWRPCVHVFCL